MRLSLDPMPLGTALCLLMVSLIVLDLPVASTLLSLGAAAAGGAAMIDHGSF
jgi:hypothetical protein